MVPIPVGEILPAPAIATVRRASLPLTPAAEFLLDLGMCRSRCPRMPLLRILIQADARMVGTANEAARFPERLRALTSRFDRAPADVAQEMFIEFAECASRMDALKPQADQWRQRSNAQAPPFWFQHVPRALTPSRTDINGGYP